MSIFRLLRKFIIFKIIIYIYYFFVFLVIFTLVLILILDTKINRILYIKRKITS